MTKEELKIKNENLFLRNKMLLHLNQKLLNKITLLLSSRGCETCTKFDEVKLKLYRENEELKDHLEEEVELHLHAEEYIKSLEEENNKLLDVINNYEVKVADLEKENAELRMKIYGGGYEMIITKKDADIILLEKQLKEQKEHHKSVCETLTNTHRNIREQLTKATEIIYRLMDIINHDLKCFDTIAGLDIKQKAMEFLKEQKINQIDYFEVTIKEIEK